MAVLFDGRQIGMLDLAGVTGEPTAGLGHSVSTTHVRRKAARSMGQGVSASIRRIADVLVSAQLLGVAETTRDLAVSYAKVRHQFGRPIGAFQAIKHHCANMAMAAEMLSSQLGMAAIAERDARDDAAFQVAALTRLAPRTALANARTCIRSTAASVSRRTRTHITI